AATGRTIGQVRTGAVPAGAGADSGGPRRITGQAEKILDHVRTAHVASKTQSNRRLTFAGDIPCEPNARLPALLVGVDQRAAKSQLDTFVGGDQTGVEVDSVVQAGDEVRDMIVCCPGPRKHRVAQTQR